MKYEIRNMKFVLLAAALYSCQPLPAAEPGVQMIPGTAGNIPIIRNAGTLEDSGISVAYGTLTVSSMVYTATASGTNYVAELSWDATNKVFVITETAQ